MITKELIDYYVKNTPFPRETIENVLKNQEFAKQYLSKEKNRNNSVKKSSEKVTNFRMKKTNNWANIGTTEKAKAIVKNIEPKRSDIPMSTRCFDSLGEQLIAIREHEVTHKQDNRLKNAASGLNTSVGSEGGFLLDPEYSEKFISKVYDNSVILSRADVYEPKKFISNFIIPRYAESSRDDGSRLGGVKVYRQEEASEIEGSTFKVGLMDFAGITLKGLCYTTDEMLNDAALLEKIITDAFSKELAFVADFESYRGTGVNQNLGIINSDTVIKIDPEQGQPAKTVLIENIDAMWARCWGASRTSSIWVYNQELEKSILGAIKASRYFETGDPYNKLLGRPLIPSEFCSAPGDYGDFALICPNEYAITKSKKTDIAVSMHVKFLTSEQAFRFVIRLNGMPKWDQPVTPRFGIETLSPFVVLKARP